MDYEKAYNKALEMAKSAIKDCGDNKGRISMIESIFPELKESKDEKIRKELLESFKYQQRESRTDKEWLNGIKLSEVVAWLEKQKSVGEIVERCKNSWYNEGKIAGMAEGLTDDEKYQQGWHDALEKQGEKKATDKVEPKFHEGDWIVNDYCTGKVIALTDDAYLLDSGQGIPFSCEHNEHLWTIDDAKDGDVLVDVYGNIGIFQKNDDFDWSSYCSLGSNGGFRCFAIEHELDGSHPATKEQCDTLFKAMTEAGYTWDMEK